LIEHLEPGTHLLMLLKLVQLLVLQLGQQVKLVLILGLLVPKLGLLEQELG